MVQLWDGMLIRYKGQILILKLQEDKKQIFSNGQYYFSSNFSPRLWAFFFYKLGLVEIKLWFMCILKKSAPGELHCS